jgi:hypothetical protein
LFLQKILIVLFFTGITIIYFIYKKQIDIKSALVALISPSVVIGLFLVYMYLNGALKIYYLLNYDLNYWIQYFYGAGKASYNLQYALYLPILSFFMLKDFLKNKNRYRNIFILIVFLEYILKPFIGSPYCQYYILNNLVASVIIGSYIVEHCSQYRVKIILCVMTLTSMIFFIKFPPNNIYPLYYKMYKYIYSKTNKDDVIINGGTYINIYNKDASYYWFGGGNMAPLAYYLYLYKEPFLLNKAIIENKPKFIFNNRYINQMLVMTERNGIELDEFVENLYEIWDKLPVQRESKEDFVKRWKLKEFSTFDADIIKNNYVPILEYPLFIRKDLIQKEY